MLGDAELIGRIEGGESDRVEFTASTTDFDKFESPQTRVGRGGANSMPPQQRNSIEMSAPGEWKP